MATNERKKAFYYIFANKPDSLENSTEAPACIFCSSKGRQERHWLANCRGFLELAPSEIKKFVMKVAVALIACVSAWINIVYSRTIFRHVARLTTKSTLFFCMSYVYVASPESCKVVNQEVRFLALYLQGKSILPRQKQL